VKASDEKESEIKRRWLNDAKLSVCARERTGKLSKKTTKEGGFNANQQGLGIGLGQIRLRFAKKKPDRQGYAAPRSQRVLRCAEKPEGRCTGSEKGRNSCT
jgi:hypothetical protein